MWLIRTPIDGLVLPTDADGYLTLCGHVPAWHHIARSREGDADGADSTLAASEVRWEIRPWYEAGAKIHFHGALGAADALLGRVRSDRYHTQAHATFPPPGHRRSDAIVQLRIIVSPTHFAQYESMVRLAMSLPDGMLVLKLPTPVVAGDANGVDGTDHLLAPGTSTVVTGCELVVSRAHATAFTPEQLGRELRASEQAPVAGTQLDEEVYADWFHFRRADTEAGTPESRGTESGDTKADSTKPGGS